MKTNKETLINQRKEVVKIYGNGLHNKKKIARITGASISNVRYWINKAFPKALPKKAINKAKKKMALSLHLSGKYTGAAIAKKVGGKEKTVRYWIRAEHGKTCNKTDVIRRLFIGNPFTISEIASLLGCAKDTVIRAIKKS
jgi:DNA invertase Pin-like site-specific DNA recombinase